MKSKSKIELGLFLLILGAIIGLRYYTLVLFGFQYSDSDQAIMWNALTDFANGQFHEPRFYGQSYNTMLEAFFAVPLYKLGIAPYKAVTIITTFLSLFPFGLIAFFTFKKRNTALSMAILSIPLLLPIEYHLITTLSRGFVTGLFVASFGSISLFYPRNKWAFFCTGFVSVVGCSITANSALFALPILLCLFLFNLKNKRFYTYAGIGLLLGGVLHFWINYFYVIHPNYNLHQYQLDYSFDLLINSLSNLDDFYNYVSPIFWHQGFIWTLIFLVTGVVFLKNKKWQYGLVLITIPILLILSLGISKVHDGTNSIFFSSSRMYLSLPILVAFSLSFFKNLRVPYFYFIIPFGLLSYNIANLKTEINKHTRNHRDHIVTVAKVDHVLKTCDELNKICAQYEIELVVVINNPMYDFINYGCPACEKDFPKTLRPSYERRTWRLIEEEKMIRKNILLIDNLNQLDQEFDFVENITSHSDKFLITNNQLTTIRLLDKMNIKIRTYK